MKNGTELELLVERLGRGGSGVARVGRFEIEVRGLLPGERARVRLEHVGRTRRGHGRVLRLIDPSAGRREAPCPHQGRCDGCPLMIANEDTQAELKRAELERLGLRVDRVVQGPALGYRWSAKRVVGGAAGAIVLGSYRRGSHEVTAMSSCLVDHPAIVAAACEIEAAASALGIEPYQETEHRGDLRYVWLKTNDRGAVLVTLISAGEASRAPELAERLSRPSGVAWAVQSGSGNAMRGELLRPLKGEMTLPVDLAGVVVDVGPLGFLQPHPRMAELAYRDLVGENRGQLAFDLYAGAGITTHLLRARYDEVRACEAYPESARALGVEPMTAEGLLEQARGVPDLVVANPPRAGFGQAVCDALERLAPPSIHIMSCEPAALVRDLARLPSYEVRGARAYDTLPQTAHIEVVVWLQKKK